MQATVSRAVTPVIALVHLLHNAAIERNADMRAPPERQIGGERRPDIEAGGGALRGTPGAGTELKPDLPDRRDRMRDPPRAVDQQIRSASRRERVCQYV